MKAGIFIASKLQQTKKVKKSKQEMRKQHNEPISFWRPHLCANRVLQLTREFSGDFFKYFLWELCEKEKKTKTRSSRDCDNEL